ncbi:MAG TPA: hypothetical protein VFA59_17985 [Vicinamibacterales bacterium]|nr:hypothetical protein [Vicinamibacterales bacterium]
MSSAAIIAPRGRLLAFRQAMEKLGLEGRAGEQRLRRLVAAKKIPVHRDGRLGFWEKDLEDWIEAHRTPATDEPKSKHIALPRIASEPAGIEDLMPRRRRLMPSLSAERRAS